MGPAWGGQCVSLASGWSVVRPLWELLLEIRWMKDVSKLMMGSVFWIQFVFIVYETPIPMDFV